MQRNGNIRGKKKWNNNPFQTMLRLVLDNFNCHCMHAHVILLYIICSLTYFHITIFVQVKQKNILLAFLMNTSHLAVKLIK